MNYHCHIYSTHVTITSQSWVRFSREAVWSEFACSQQVFVDLLWVLWFPSTVQKHVAKLLGNENNVHDFE